VTSTVKASYVTQTESLPLADLGQRFAGQLIDTLIAYGPLILAVGAANRTFGASIAAPAFLFCILYILFADGFNKGQSFGKRAMKTALLGSHLFGIY
jgi:uncharacterized RDD family membrane protein YckC